MLRLNLPFLCHSFMIFMYFHNSMCIDDIRMPNTYYTERCFSRIFPKVLAGFYIFNWSLHDCLGNNNRVFRISKSQYFWHYSLPQSLIKGIQIQYFGWCFLSVYVNSILHILLSSQGKPSIKFTKCVLIAFIDV